MQPIFELSKPLFLMFAALPILLEMGSFEQTGIIGVLIVSGWWLTRLFFRLTRNLFPERLFKLSIILWLASLAQIVSYHLDQGPLWIASLAFILFYEGIEKRLFGESWLETIKSGFYFLIILFLLNTFELILGIALAVDSFHQSFGLLLILGFMAASINKKKAEV